MEIRYGYDCGKNIAYQKVDGLLTKLETEHSDKISDASRKWNPSKDYMEFSFKVKGFNISGDVSLYENNLVLNGKIPFVARAFSGTIKETINNTLDKLFD
ncbi:MAG: polyhydroxyalkanoic acid system family protein [Nanoarchaeota archaeon]|nr:polyhydroxyalkanoic acid system family protein [Nanoarchaeota archaeon]